MQNRYPYEQVAAAPWDHEFGDVSTRAISTYSTHEALGLQALRALDSALFPKRCFLRAIAPGFTEHTDFCSTLPLDTKLHILGI